MTVAEKTEEDVPMEQADGQGGQLVIPHRTEVCDGCGELKTHNGDAVSSLVACEDCIESLPYGLRLAFKNRRGSWDGPVPEEVAVRGYLIANRGAE